MSLWRKLVPLFVDSYSSDFPDVLPTSFWRCFLLHALHLFGVLLQTYPRPSVIWYTFSSKHSVFLVELVQFHPKCLATSMSVWRSSMSSRFFVCRGSGRKTRSRPLLTALELAGKGRDPGCQERGFQSWALCSTSSVALEGPNVSPREHDDDGSDATLRHLHCGGKCMSKSAIVVQSPDWTSRKTKRFLRMDGCPSRTFA